MRLAVQLADSNDRRIAAGQLEQMVLAADVEGLPWLSRVARGLQAAVLFAAQPPRGASMRRPIWWRSAIGRATAGPLACWRWPWVRRAPDPDRRWGRGAQSPAACRRRRTPRCSRPGAHGTVGWTAGRGDPRSPPAAPSVRDGRRRPGRRIERRPVSGRFELSVDGVGAVADSAPAGPVTADAARAAPGRGVHRETLIADLWPEACLASGIGVCRCRVQRRPVPRGGRARR